MASLDEWLQATAGLRPAQRPLVTLSYAQGLDGSIAARRGQPSAISGTESLRIIHQLRAAHDAILVGIGTILSDDPQLTVRLVEGRNPRPVILDSSLRTPSTAKVLASQPIIFCSADASDEAQRALEARGAQVERQPQAGRIDLDAMLARLHALGVRSLMVEGGGEVIESFLARGLADRAVLTIAPVNLRGYTIRGALPLLKETLTEDAGVDMLLFGKLEREVI
jgi:3,4-dihydroxy 2-butanone 4-phosphate synthase/GTP cyclohydrolase II